MLRLRTLLLLLPLLAPTAMADSRQPTHSYTLDNGLNVIIREDHRALRGPGQGLERLAVLAGAAALQTRL